MGLTVFQHVFDEPVDTASAGPRVQALAQLAQVLWQTRRKHLHVAFFGIAYPAAKAQLVSLSLHKPAKANSLHAALNQEMKDHCVAPSPVSQTDTRACN